MEGLWCSVSYYYPRYGEGDDICLTGRKSSYPLSCRAWSNRCFNSLLLSFCNENDC
uniref:Alternative protein PTPDC1 n=1 Tax=Homo sapiens TaxID=9606 RepID=L8ECP2_HUMAN|nr:alternative protein PTPDC1 [Homo sapiens]